MGNSISFQVHFVLDQGCEAISLGTVLNPAMLLSPSAGQVEDGTHPSQHAQKHLWGTTAHTLPLQCQDR